VLEIPVAFISGMYNSRDTGSAGYYLTRFTMSLIETSDGIRERTEKFGI